MPRRNANKNFSPAFLICFLWRRHSGVVVSLELLVTDMSVSAQPSVRVTPREYYCTYYSITYLRRKVDMPSS
jgi:hypothetical protein